jgi:hypothetical protein
MELLAACGAIDPERTLGRLAIGPLACVVSVGRTFVGVPLARAAWPPDWGVDTERRILKISGSSSGRATRMGMSGRAACSRRGWLGSLLLLALVGFEPPGWEEPVWEYGQLAFVFGCVPARGLASLRMRWRGVVGFSRGRSVGRQLSQCDSAGSDPAGATSG